ncbi:hypothetical protein CWC15_11400 [Pseudoalteromonas spongiae]|nr:hypothetical protein CWC15_11400 [Pseudoalteromonas spongiae]
MLCTCCNSALSNGMIRRRDRNSNKKYKSCPNCSATSANEHVFHKYPESFGKTSARITKRNPEGYQSYCISCRKLDKGAKSVSYASGKKCSELV